MKTKTGGKGEKPARDLRHVLQVPTTNRVRRCATSGTKKKCKLTSLGKNQREKIETPEEKLKGTLSSKQQSIEKEELIRTRDISLTRKLKSQIWKLDQMKT